MQQGIPLNSHVTLSIAWIDNTKLSDTLSHFGKIETVVSGADAVGNVTTKVLGVYRRIHIIDINHPSME